MLGVYFRMGNAMLAYTLRWAMLCWSILCWAMLCWYTLNAGQCYAGRMLGDAMLVYTITMLGNAMLVCTIGWAMLWCCASACMVVYYTLGWPMLCCSTVQSCGVIQSFSWCGGVCTAHIMLWWFCSLLCSYLWWYTGHILCWPEVGGSHMIIYSEMLGTTLCICFCWWCSAVHCVHCTVRVWDTAMSMPSIALCV